MFLEVYPQVLSVSTFKCCQKCGELKAHEQFSKDASRSDGLCTYCKDCVRNYQQTNHEHISKQSRVHRAQNAERERERHRRYRSENREAISERKRLRRSKNRDAINERARVLRLENRDARRARDRARYWANPEKFREYARLWRRDHPERTQAYLMANHDQIYSRNREYAKSERGLITGRAKQHRRRVRYQAASGNFTPDDIEAIRAAQGNRCYLCGKKLKKYHIDHFIPLALGGTNDPGNLRLACPKCNKSKGAKHPHDLGILL